MSLTWRASNSARLYNESRSAAISLRSRGLPLDCGQARAGGKALHSTALQRYQGRQGRMIEERPITMVEYNYTVLFEPAEEGGFVATCPALPGLVTEGDTLEEAREICLLYTSDAADD